MHTLKCLKFSGPPLFFLSKYLIQMNLEFQDITEKEKEKEKNKYKNSTIRLQTSKTQNNCNYTETTQTQRAKKIWIQMVRIPPF